MLRWHDDVINSGLPPRRYTSALDRRVTRYATLLFTFVCCAREVTPRRYALYVTRYVDGYAC